MEEMKYNFNIDPLDLSARIVSKYTREPNFNDVWELFEIIEEYRATFIIPRERYNRMYGRLILIQQSEQVLGW